MRKKPGAETTVAVLEDDRRGTPTAVLIVDDHPAIREGLKAALAGNREFRVVDEAGNADQALALVQKTLPDIVILDISLPERNGTEVAQAIRAISPSTRIVAYTMHEQSGFLAGMLEAGVEAYVLKGEPLANLLEALRLAREGKSRLPVSMLVPVPALSGTGTQALEDRVRSLSRREREVFLILADGQSVKQAAFDLRVSCKTVETYKARLMRKLNAANAVELAKIAFRTQLLQP